MNDDGIFDGAIGAESICNPCFAPTDELPFANEGEDAGPCFLCRHATGIADVTGNSQVDDAWAMEDSREPVELLQRIISDHYGKVSDDVLTDLLFEFYDTSVRPSQSGTPAWSRRSIYEHLTMHTLSNEEMQMNTVSRMLVNQLASLRSVSWEQKAGDPEAAPTPNLRVISQMDRYGATVKRSFSYKVLTKPNFLQPFSSDFRAPCWITSRRGEARPRCCPSSA